ncbi:MAG: hypothetical protein JO072_03315 [Parafilimonas sp.]|nr:hypothetical protein [Parafilimonas sp.]
MEYKYTTNRSGYKKEPASNSFAKFAGDALSKVKRFLFEERKLLKRDRLGNDIIPTAPFYDELHFADFE